MNGSGYNIVYHMTEVSDNGRGMEGKSIWKVWVEIVTITGGGLSIR